jgi:hypothetical protein
MSDAAVSASAEPGSAMSNRDVSLPPVGEDAIGRSEFASLWLGALNERQAARDASQPTVISPPIDPLGAALLRHDGAG